MKFWTCQSNADTLDKVMTDYDRLGKELLKVFFYEFLELFFPKIASMIARESIVFLDKELFTDSPADRQRFEMDVVVRARLAGQDTHWILLTESQAQRQPNFNRRMFWYFSVLDHQLNTAS